MFRFWTSESRGCDKTNDATTSQQYTLSAQANKSDYFSAKDHSNDATASPLATASTASAHSPRFKRRRSPESTGDILLMPPSPSTDMDPPSDEAIATYPPSKRIKMELPEPAWPQAVFGNNYGTGNGSAADEERNLSSPPSPPASVSINMADTAMLEQVKDTVQHQFGLEILVKHNELRLIDQEIAKCQIALEQLRRCHLIPYPVNCPTPAQMLDVATGRGVAVRPRPDAAVPKWAAPFGVVDGPYARHYAKWLIPDPVFDGPLPNWPGLAPPARSRLSATAEARAARSSAHDASKGRPSRSMAGQKLHSLSSGYPQPKDKAGPCVLRRSDGKVVKLVCLDCHRENFSSTQGFINHCRIAHKRDFKSHEEAAVHCGHPLEADNAAAPATSCGKPDQVQATSASPATTAAARPIVPPVAQSQMPAVAAPAIAPRVPGQVHPLARSDSEATDALLRGINSSIQSYSGASVAAETGLTKRRRTDSTQRRASSSTMKRSSDQITTASLGRTPFLARLLENRQFSGSLEACVEDATVPVDLDDESLWVDMDDDSFVESAESTPASTPISLDANQGFTGPIRPLSALGSAIGTSRRGGPSARPRNMTFVKTDDGHDGNSTPYGHEEMDVDMSPNLAASNKAPSLVSDDDEYDDSDDGSVSETSHTDLGSIVEVPEINIDEDEEHAHSTPRALRHSRSTVKLKKDDTKHVALVSAVRGADN